MSELQRIHKIKIDHTSSKIANLTNKSLKNKYSVPLINNIIKDILGFIADELVTSSYLYRLPNSLGMIYIDKKKPFLKRIDGKLINGKPIDLNATLKLWETNPEAKEKKIKIRFDNYHTNGYVYRFKYSTSKSNFTNKSIYQLRFNRIVKQKLHKAIMAGKVEI